MRHLVLALMIALLPLRGWLGEAMATEMAVAGAWPTAQATAAAQEAAAPAAAHPGCGGHAMPPGDMASHAPVPEAAAHPSAGHHDLPAADPADRAEAGGDCGSCPGCQACHGAALTAGAAVPPAHAAPTALPLAAPPAFSSAVPSRGLRPPIA